MPTHDELQTAQEAALSDLLPLMDALRVALDKGRDPERLLRLIQFTAARHALPVATEAAASTLAGLIRVYNLPQRAQGVAVKIAAQKAQIVADRAHEVLRERSEAFVSPYAALAAQVLVYDSHRESARAAADEGGAKYKTFTRIRQAKEPRSHSSLEGVTLPVDQPYTIAGIEVDGPGDERLPWSERAFCSHILKFSN